MRLRLVQLKAMPRCCSNERTVSAPQSVETGYHVCPHQSARGAFLQGHLWTRPGSPTESGLLAHGPSLCLPRPQPDYLVQNPKVPRPPTTHQHLYAHLGVSAFCEAWAGEGLVVYYPPYGAAQAAAVPPLAFVSVKCPSFSSTHICPGAAVELQAEDGDVLARWARLTCQQVFGVSREHDRDRLCQRHSSPISLPRQWPPQ